jgi:bile acid:Na+ symporter, BASS family
MNIPVLVLSLLLGILLPYGHSYTFLVRPLVMVMLFFAFLEMQIDRQTFSWRHGLILLAKVGIALGSYALLRNWSQDLAMAGFLVGIMPTAAAAPGITGYLKARVDYVTFSTFFTSLAIAGILPFLLPTLLKGTVEISMGEVLWPVLSLMLLPLGLAWGARFSSARLRAWLLRYKRLSFWCFMTNVYLASSKASHFVRTEMQDQWDLLLWIGLISGVLCLLNFELGKVLGGTNRRIEGGMALGRKNTMFSLWVALTFVSPLAALGPMCYILWQNTYNAIQLYCHGKEESRP